MITEEDKNRIKSEEIFRAEIRDSLKKSEEKSFRESVWKLVNSPFGLWFLSTVVVGSVIYFYNDSKLKTEISTINAETMQKLSIETAHRLQKFRSSLIKQNPTKLSYQSRDLAYMIDGTLVDDGSFSPERPIYIFPEYKDRTIQSLLYEMERLTKDKKQAISIKEASATLNYIKDNLLNMENPPTRNFSINQRISQMVQSQPESLSTQDSILWNEYQEREKNFKQNELSNYHQQIQIKLDSLTSQFLNNSFLKSISDE